MQSLHLFLGLVLALGMSVAILWPFFRPASEEVVKESSSENIRNSERRERAMLALEELARDYASGKMTEEAYLATRAEISREVSKFST